MAGPDETRTQAPPPAAAQSVGATRDFDRAAATGSFADAAPGGVAVPGYEIVGELGRGAMGVVFKARDTRLNRDAAIKMPLGGARAGQRELIRFLAEAEAVAAIRHPNVVQVFEYGENDGRPFLALEYLGGGTLADALANPDREGGGIGSNPLPHGRGSPGDPATLVGKVARGVAAAHALGIIHRDMKPANVLLTADGEPKVTDFGLAKRGGGAELTQTGAVMGTPAYMAPEQAEGGAKFVGPPADVWALGVILYECLTGTRPFDGKTTGELLAAVARATPESPRKRAPTVPRDLELICLKCLEKNPADRYPTATELADDLDRFRDGQSVSVRAAGLLERGYKWAKRKPALAGLYAFALLAVALGGFAAVALRLWREADEQRVWSDKARGQLATEKREAESARKEAEGAQKDAEGARDEAQKARAALARAEYARTIDLANRVYREGNFYRTRELLWSCAAELRGWEWDYLERQVHPELVSVQTADHFRHVVFTPDGTRIVTLGDEDVVVWDAATGAKVRTLRGVASRASGSAISADGRRFAAAWQERTADDEVHLGVRVWGIDTGAELANLAAPALHLPKPKTGWKADPFVTRVSLDPTGKEVGLFCHSQWQQANHVHVWDVGTGKRLTDGKTLPGFALALKHTAIGWLVATTDGRREAAKAGGRPDLTVRVFNLLGAPMGSVTATAYDLPALGPDGQLVAVIHQGYWRVFDLTTGQPIDGAEGPGSSTIRFSPDGRRVALVNASLGSGNVFGVRLSRLGTRLPQPLPGRFAAEPTFSPDGRRVATVDDAGMVRVWDTDTAAELFGFRTVGAAKSTGPRSLGDLLTPPGGEAPQFAFSPDLSRLAAASPDGRLRIWDARFRTPPVPIAAPDKSFTRILNTPSGWRVLMGRRPITVWNPDTGGATTIDTRVKSGHELAISPDGAFVAANASDEVRVWSIETGKLFRVFAVGNRPVGMAFSPTGRLLAGIDATDNTLRVWDAATGAETFAAPVPQNRGVAARFSADGTRVKLVPLASPKGETDAPPAAKREWDLATKEPREPAGDDAPSDSIPWAAITITPDTIPPAVSPDGKRRVVVGFDWVVRLLGEGVNQELLTLTERRGDVHAVAFSPDGRRILVVGPGGAEFFDATPRTPVAVALPVAPEPRVSPKQPLKPRTGTLFPDTTAEWEAWVKSKTPEVAPPPRPVR